MRKRLASLILTLVIVLSLGTLSVFALNTEHPNGGTWKWGDEGSYTLSNYLLTYDESENTNGVHSSSVIGKTTNKSGWIESGKWSRAKIAKKWNYIEHSYYNAKDINGTPMA